jgi:tRNA A-37 threonylcarbamoyl transferase component Bud32
VSHPSGDAPPRLPHGYTNATFTERPASSGEPTVVKRYLGPDQEERQGREVWALQALAGRFPVPPLLEHDTGRIVIGYLAGVPGQELLERMPVPVLHEVGRAARRLHGIDLSESLGQAGGGSVLVHGDFGPQNMLLDASGQVAALVDWEFAHLGDPIEDLSWAEWIVCTHHPHLAEGLEALFDGYGSHPSWSQRHSAMLAKCGQLLAFAQRWSSEAASVWQRRIEATEAFGE